MAELRPGVVVAPPAATGEWRWRFSGVSGHGDVAVLRQAAGAAPFHVLVPAEACLLTQVDLPVRNPRELQQALPFALEDRLVDEVETLHFTAGEAQGESGRRVVAVVSLALARQWLDALRSAGLRPAALVPEVLALPFEPGCWSVVLEGARVCVRTGTGTGMAFEAASAPAWLERLLREHGVPDAVRVFGEGEGLPVIEAFVARHALSLIHEPGPVEGLELASQQLAAGLPLDLRQGQLREEARGGQRLWAAAALIALFAFILQASDLLLRTQRLERLTADLEDRAETSFRAIFPGVGRVVNLRAQAEQELAALGTGGDFAEVFVEDRWSNTLSMVGGKVDSSVSGREYGIGIRIMQGTNCVYAYTNDDSREGLLRVAKEAAAALPGVGGVLSLNLIKASIPSVNVIRTLPDTVEKQRKVALMTRTYQVAKEYDPVISQVSVRYFDEDQHVQIANSVGLLVEDRRVRTRTGITAVASKDSEKQSGLRAPGAHMGFEFYDKIDLDTYAREAARIAATMIHAPYAPSGPMPVIIDNEFGGVIFHEACGHSLEATSVAKKTSVFADKVGEKIAADCVSAVDDGTIPNAWGSLNVDDEGHPTQRNLLIENGILKGYMQDKHNARLMGVAPTGNGRRESYAHLPIPRMTNTYMLAGSRQPEEIIASVKNGLYARNFGGGQVDITSGKFVFSASEAYLIENGKITGPVKGATLVGNGPEVMTRISMVGNDLELDTGVGSCGKDGQSVPVGVGQPTLRIDGLTVGGTALSA